MSVLEKYIKLTLTNDYQIKNKYKHLKKFYEEKRNEIFKELYIDILDNKKIKKKRQRRR